jgi:hypothetical protein
MLSCTFSCHIWDFTIEQTLLANGITSTLHDCLSSLLSMNNELTNLLYKQYEQRLSYQGFGGFRRGDQSLSKDPLLRFDIVSQWECCGRWLLPCRLLWMAPGQMACHHLASATCVILLLLFHSSSWLLSFDCLRLSVQLWKLWMNYLSRFLYCGSLGYLVLWTSMVTKDNQTHSHIL